MYTTEKEYLELEGKFMVLGRAGNMPSLTSVGFIIISKELLYESVSHKKFAPWPG